MRKGSCICNRRQPRSADCDDSKPPRRKDAKIAGRRQPGGGHRISDPLLGGLAPWQFNWSFGHAPWQSARGSLAKCNRPAYHRRGDVPGSAAGPAGRPRTPLEALSARFAQALEPAQPVSAGPAWHEAGECPMRIPERTRPGRRTGPPRLVSVPSRLWSADELDHRHVADVCCRHPPEHVAGKTREKVGRQHGLPIDPLHLATNRM